jgi:hypothetical protein
MGKASDIHLLFQDVFEGSVKRFRSKLDLGPQVQACALAGRYNARALRRKRLDPEDREG